MFSCLYHDLCRFQALLSDDLQEWYRVPVVPFEHFSDDGEEVPHSLRLSTSQGPKERTPLGGARGRRRRKVVDVTEHDRRWHAELDEDFLDVVLQVFSVQAPRRGVVQRSAGGRVGGALDIVDCCNWKTNLLKCTQFYLHFIVCSKDF